LYWNAPTGEDDVERQIQIVDRVLADILDRQGATAGSSQFREALQSGSQAVQLRLDLVLARDLRSDLYLKSGQLDRAIEQCQMAMRFDPSNQVALYHLTQALRKSNKQEQIPSLLTPCNSS
jgi:tetratricopeptide (TPR) repeat protein